MRYVDQVRNIAEGCLRCPERFRDPCQQTQKNSCYLVCGTSLNRCSLPTKCLLDSGPDIAHLPISFVVDHIACVIYVVVLSKGPLEGLQQMEGDGTLGLCGLPVIVAKNGFGCLSGLCQVVVGDLREEVVHHMSTNVMMDPVEDAIVPVQGGEASSQVAPLLQIRLSWLQASARSTVQALCGCKCFLAIIEECQLFLTIEKGLAQSCPGKEPENSCPEQHPSKWIMLRTVVHHMFLMHA